VVPAADFFTAVNSTSFKDLPVTIKDAPVTGQNFTATATPFARDAVCKGAMQRSGEDGGANQTTAYKLLNGTPVWTAPPQFGNSFTPALIADGNVLIPSNDNNIYLLDSTGATSKTIPFDQAPHDVTLAVTNKGNRIYVACGDRFLFCVATSCEPDAAAPWGQLGAGPRRVSRRETSPTS